MEASPEVSEPASRAGRSERPALDPGALYGVAGDFVRLVEPHTESDPVALLVSALVAFGNSAGRSRYAVADGVKHFPNLFAALVGETSKARKGSSWGWVRRGFEAIDPDWTRANVRGGLSTGEGLIYHVRDPIERSEPIKEKGRFTGEQQNFIADSGVADKRLLCVESEFSSVLRRFQRQASTLSELLRTAWETGNLSTLTRNEPLRATGAHVSLLAHVTSEELRATLDSTDIANGFGNRIIWVTVHRSKLLPFPSAPDAGEFEQVAGDIRDALDHARAPALIEFSDSARDAWRAAYPFLSADRAGLTGALLARSEAQVLRLALVYSLLDRADAIESEHLLAALALWKYCEQSVEFIWRGATGNPDADAIAGALRASESGMTRTQISELFGRNISAARIERALALLAKSGRAVLAHEATTGRPAERWKSTEVKTNG
ncbi:MAG TPA: hypothetical protein VMV27_14290 [Candidatus Binataceae bacterium]|nr:hypothetical protein [Candidatus Binataceae bacterium]